MVKPGKEHIIIHVEGGVCEYAESKGVRVYFFDWDNLGQAEDVEALNDAIEDAEGMPGGGRRDILARLHALKKGMEEARHA